MTLRRRLIPVAALVVAIGASAAGAATAAATGTANANGSAGVGAGAGAKTPKTAICKVELGGKKVSPNNTVKPDHTVMPDHTVKPDHTVMPDHTVKPDSGAVNKVQLLTDAHKRDVTCRKPIVRIDLSKIAAELGVSKQALVQALTQTKEWAIASQPAPSGAQFDQHLAGLLNVPVAKLAAVFKPAGQIVVGPNA